MKNITRAVVSLSLLVIAFVLVVSTSQKTFAWGPTMLCVTYPNGVARHQECSIDDPSCPCYQKPPTVSVSVSPSTIPAYGTFNINMTSQRAYSCTWSRSGTYPDNWTDQPVPTGTSYSASPTGWPAGTATYSFTCVNPYDEASGSGTVTITSPGVRLWFSSMISSVFAQQK